MKKYTTKKYTTIGLSAIVGLLFSGLSYGALVTDNNMGDFFTRAGLKTTYDFETLSGFPLANADGIAFSGDEFAYIGTFDSIGFDATTFRTNSGPVSGTQGMTGNTGTFSTATLDFTSLAGKQVIGFGFYGLDLTADEIIRVNVNFAIAGNQVFDVSLSAGDASFTPTYFGAYDAVDYITGLTVSGTDVNGANRAWFLDDLTVVTVPAVVPLPASIWLLVSGLAGIVSVSRKRRV